MSVVSQEVQTIGYFLSTTAADFVYIGGAMVTDRHGLPLEFRYTEPVRANRLQRVLYGGVLEHYIHIDVILTSLFERLERRPDLVVVSNSAFFACRAFDDNNCVWLGDTRLTSLSAVGQTQKVSADELLLQLKESGSPIRVKFGGSDSDPERRAKTCKLLVDFSETMEVLEPLTRIESAIDLIWEESDENPLQPIIEVA